MQTKGLHSSIYKLYRYARKQEELDAYRKKYEAIVKHWDELKAAGTDPEWIPYFVGFSRSTYYRAKKNLKDLEAGKRPPSKRPKKVRQPCWGESEKQKVLQIRRQNPTYGKAKIARILQRDYQVNLSESTVGRILTHLKNQGLITRSPSAIRTKKKRNFKQGYAKPWSYKPYKDMAAGERIQVDHMSVTKNQVNVKHFQAWERHSKWMYVQLYAKATSRSAKRFLMELKEALPIPLISIQVDGGSEFRGEFEQACEELGIELIVLPPASPKKNGGVERGNRVFREEFYDQPLLADSLGGLRNELKLALNKYNTYRPHRKLDNLTPMEYIKRNNLEASYLSQNA